MEIKPIGYMKTPFPTKFGIPRQACLSTAYKTRLVFEPEYRSPEALRGIEGYSHFWIIWGFSMSQGDKFSPTVRPPRLGGNTRMGVFATRSPFRPNSLALSCLKLAEIEKDEKNGYMLSFFGGDMVDGTPVYDIKPYLPFSDSFPEATGGFSEDVRSYSLNVIISNELKATLGEDFCTSLTEILKEDPRPSYIENEEREYGFIYDGYEIRFTVSENTLTVFDAWKLS